MKVNFKTKMAGYKIDVTPESKDLKGLIKELRYQVSEYKIKILWKKVKVCKFFPKLNPDAKGAWTDKEFFKELVDYYNSSDDCVKKVAVPKTAQEFLDTCLELKIATIIEP